MNLAYRLLPLNRIGNYSVVAGCVYIGETFVGFEHELAALPEAAMMGRVKGMLDRGRIQDTMAYDGNEQKAAQDGEFLGYFASKYVHGRIATKDLWKISSMIGKALGYNSVDSNGAFSTSVMDAYEAQNVRLIEGPKGE